MSLCGPRCQRRPPIGIPVLDGVAPRRGGVATSLGGARLVLRLSASTLAATAVVLDRSAHHENRFAEAAGEDELLAKALDGLAGGCSPSSHPVQTTAELGRAAST